MYVYVSTSGNDSTAIPDDVNKPFLTIEAALSAINKNRGTIFIFPGIYKLSKIHLTGTMKNAVRALNELDTFGYEYSKHISIIGYSIHSTRIELQETIELEGVALSIINVNLAIHNKNLINAKDSFVNVTESYVTVTCDENAPKNVVMLNCNDCGIRMYLTLASFLFYPNTPADMTYIVNNRNTILFYTRFFNTIFDISRTLIPSLITLCKCEGDVILTYSTLWVAVNGEKYKDILYFDTTENTNVKYTNSDIILYSYYELSKLKSLTSSLKLIKGNAKLTVSNFTITGSDKFKSLDLSAPLGSTLQYINTDSEVYVKDALYTDKGNGIGTTSFSTNTRVVRAKEDSLKLSDFFVIYKGKHRGTFTVGKANNGRNVIISNDSKRTLVIKAENGICIGRKNYYKLRSNKTIKIIYVDELKKWYYKH
jgi:hypothetical protein